MIVIIDDNNDLLISLKEIFSMTNPTEAFTNGPQALEFIRKNKGQVAVCVVDYMMPEMDGLEVAQRIKDIDKDVFVILMSGFVDFEKVQPYLKNRTIYQFFTKPLNMSSLVKTTDDAVRLYKKRTLI